MKNPLTDELKTGITAILHIYLSDLSKQMRSNIIFDAWHYLTAGPSDTTAPHIYGFEPFESKSPTQCSHPELDDFIKSLLSSENWGPLFSPEERDGFGLLPWGQPWADDSGMTSG